MTFKHQWCSIIMAAAVASAAQPSAFAGKVQILHASDLEGGVNAIGDAPNFAAVVEALEQDAANQSIPSILLSAGDNYIPGPFFSAAGDPSLRTPLRNALANPQAREGEGRVDVAIMNILGIDASALGNHEFDAGTPKLREIIGPDVRDSNNDTVPDDARWLGVDFPYLSANLDFSGDSNLASLYQSSIVENTEFKGSILDKPAAATKKKLASATIVDRGGDRFGIVGATTPLLGTISSPGNTTVKNPGAGTNNMTQLASILQPVIDQLLGLGVNKIILVTHLQQIALEQQLVPLLHGVDVAIAGGSDTLLADNTDALRGGDTAAGPYPILTANADGDPAVVVSTDGQYSYVGRLVVEFDGAGILVPGSIDAAVSGAFATDDNGVAALWGNLIDPFAAGTKGAQVKSLTDAVLAVVIAKDATVYGNSDVFLEGRRAFVRTQQTNLGDITADANLWAAKQVDPTVLVSLKNGGGIRDFIGFVDGVTGELLPTQHNPLSGKLETEISQLDIENTLRFNNLLSLVTVTAAELTQILEHGVAATAPGSTPGQFPQVGGVAFSFDADQPAGARVVSVAIKDLAGNTLDVIKKDGVMMGDPSRPIRMVTLNFLAAGGDSYPFPALAENRVDTGIGEQAALANYLSTFHGDASNAFKDVDLTLGQDDRMLNLMYRSDSAVFPPVSPAGAIRLTKIGGYETGVFDEGAAEITAFDPASKRLFVVNANGATVDIVDLADPTSPALVVSLDIQALFGNASFTASPNSVAIHTGLVAVAVERVNNKGEQRTGAIGFFDTDGNLLTSAEAGALPDMVTFTPDGAKVLAANEGEPSGDYSFDPIGSVTLVDVTGLRANGKLSQNAVNQISFSKFNSQLNSLRAAGVRIYGPGASVAQDLEPEYIAVSPDSKTAYVALQENNAIAVIDIAKAKVLAIHPLGFKDWTSSGLDASDRDNAINIQPWPVFGMYQPDGIACYEANGKRYIVSANEGDAREYDTFAEEARVRGITLDPTAFPNRSALRDNAAMGRLNITTALGDTDNDGDFDALYTLGGRSFSIWEVNGSVVKTFDSGDQFEQITASLLPAQFNSANDENGTFDSRSDNKGPEPEGIALGEIDGRTYAFIGLERIGGIMVYDITNPAAPAFVQYVNTRDFSGDAEAGTAGDLGPEGIEFVPASDSPNGKPLLIVAYEVSGSVAIFEINPAP